MRVGLPGVAVAWAMFCFPAHLPGQAFNPTPLGTSYGMFGPRTIGVPLAPLPRTTFRDEPRSRLGANMSIGMGGPINRIAVDASANVVFRGPSDWRSPPFLAAQAAAAEAALRGSVAVEPPPVAAPPQGPVPAPSGVQPIRTPAAPAAPPSAVQPMRSSAAPAPGFPTVVSTDLPDLRANAGTVLAGSVRSLSRRWGPLGGRSIQVAVQGETVILRGEVPSQDDRLLVEQMARMEPGVWQVQNDLTVSTASVAPPIAEEQTR